jgi:hypothetical protein
MKERSFEVGVGWIFYNLMWCKWVNNVVQFLMNMLNGWNWLFNVASISLLPTPNLSIYQLEKKKSNQIAWFLEKIHGKIRLICY